MDNKKKFNTNRVAAYALSGVMLASVIPYNVFANVNETRNAINNVAATGENNLGLSPANEPNAVKDAAAPEDTSTSSDAKNAVHGFVGVLVGGDINADLKAETGQRFKPIEGVKVYFQWYEKKGNRTSPTYYAVSGADGQFHINVKPYIGRDGKLVKFDADTSVSAGNESYKMWVDESTIPEGYQLQYSTGEGVEFTDRKVAGGDFQLGPNRLVNYRVLLMEKQDEAKMHKGATETGPWISSTGQGAVWGKVSWDYESAGGVQWGIVSTPTSPAKGVTVTASYLSDYALKQIYSPKTATMLGLSKPSDIRGSGWTFKLETQLQEWIAEQVAKDKDKWIAETVSAVTGAEGDYKIQFKGTWGPERNNHKAAEYTRVAGKYYAGDAHKWTEVEAGRLGTVAENATDGSFLTGALDWNEKHVNSDWLFISTKDTDDVVKRTPWNYNWYTGSDNGWGIHGGWAQAAFGVSTVQAANSTRADFNFAPAEIKFNITNFDTQLNTATPGDVAKTKTAGLPYKNTNDSFKIVWYDQDGKNIKEEPTQKPTATGALKEATYDTKGITETKTFIAKLHYVDSKGKLGQVLAQDAFTVKVNDKIGSRYEDVEFTNGDTEGATYKASGLPNGLTIDEKTGKVTGKPTEAGKFTVTTTITVPADDPEAEAISVNKTDEYIITDSPLKDGEVGAKYEATITPTPIEGYVFKNVTAKFIDGKAIDGLTITDGKISGTPTAKVEATEEDPNVKVTYDIYKVSENGKEFLVKEGHVDNVPLSITEEAKDTTKPEIGDLDDDDNPDTPVAPEEDTENKGPQVWANGARVTEGQEITPIKVNVKDDKDENPTVEVTGLPEGLSYNEETGKIEGTPEKLTDWADTEEERDVTATIKAKDAAGNESTKEIQITVLRDTDGDGIPDTTDPDDDNDGIKDEEDQNPKAWDAKVEGKVETPVGTQPTVDQYKEKITNLPEGSKVVVKTEPDVSKAGDTEAVVTVTLPNGEEVDVTVPVTVTDTTPTEKDADKYEPTVSKEEVEKGGKVDLTDNVTNLDKLPEGTKVKDVTPEGTIDTNKPGDYTGKVEVTYPDGSKETVDVPVTVKDTTPAEKDADKYEPTVSKEEVEKGGTVDLTDNVTNLDKLPEGTKVKDVTPEGTIDTNKPGDYTGKVEVTYPDGSKETVDVPVTVKDETPSEDDTKVSGDVNPVAPTDDPQDTGINVENKDDDTKISAKDEDGKDIPVEIDENGNVIVTPGTDVDGPITVTIEDPDLPGGKVEIEVPVIGHEKGRDDNGSGDSEYRPGHDGRDYFDGIFKRHDYTPTYPVKTVVPEKTTVGTPVEDTLWYVFRINDFEYDVVRNGVVTKRKMDVTPVLRNDRTMLPLRYVAEAIGAEVKWDKKTRTATFIKDGLTASIQIDSDEIVLSNGKTVKMDSKPLNINDRILVSVTNVANVFGLTNGNTQDKIDQDIEWEQEDKSATIYVRR